MNSLEDLEAADTIEDNQSSAVPFKSSVYQPLQGFFLEMEILSMGINKIWEVSYCPIDIYYLMRSAMLWGSVYIKTFLCPDNGRKQKLLNVWMLQHSRLSSIENPVGGLTFRYVWRDVFFTKLGISWKARKWDVPVFLYTVNYSNAAFLLLSTVFFCFA